MNGLPRGKLWVCADRRHERGVTRHGWVWMMRYVAHLVSEKADTTRALGRGAGATDATAATDAARSPRNFCRTPSSHSERFSSDSESAVRPPTLRTPGRNTSDSEKTTLGLRENNPRTPRKQPSDSEKTTLGLTDSEKTILGLREDNPRVTGHE